LSDTLHSATEFVGARLGALSKKGLYHEIPHRGTVLLFLDSHAPIVATLAQFGGLVSDCATFQEFLLAPVGAETAHDSARQEQYLSERVSNSIVVCERGQMTFVEKAIAVQQAGAAGMIVLQNEALWPFFMPGVADDINIPCMMVSQQDGEYLTRLLANGPIHGQLRGTPILYLAVIEEIFESTHIAEGLETSQLCCVLTKIWECMLKKIVFSCSEVYVVRCQALLNRRFRLQHQRSETIAFQDIVRMLSSRPWSQMIPVPLLAEMRTYSGAVSSMQEMLQVPLAEKSQKHVDSLMQSLSELESKLQSSTTGEEDEGLYNSRHVEDLDAWM